MRHSLPALTVKLASIKHSTAMGKSIANSEKTSWNAVGLKIVKCETVNKLEFLVALTDGHSVSVDVNGKPFMHSKGIVTQNIKSNWRVLCDDNGDFHANALQVANDICNVIGFKYVSLNSFSLCFI